VEECTYFWGVNTSWGIDTAERKGPLHQEDNQAPQPTMCKDPVLTTSYFTKTFIVECDASGNGIGVVLMQEGRPLSFESWPLKGKDLHGPIYEKEMMEILHELKKWHP
jgi:hypothetical protein